MDKIARHTVIACALIVLLAPWVAIRAAESFLVEDGCPRAEIVIAEKPPRTTRLAARELQTYVEKISGAKLGIVTEPSGKVPVSVFVGQSAHTEKLGITAERLEHG